MKSNDLLAYMQANSGMSQANLSRTMGRSDKFISRYISGKATPGLDLMSEVADVCGYDLALIKRDGTETIIIDPPEK